MNSCLCALGREQSTACNISITHETVATVPPQTCFCIKFSKKKQSSQNTSHNEIYSPPNLRSWTILTEIYKLYFCFPAPQNEQAKSGLCFKNWNWLGRKNEGTIANSSIGLQWNKGLQQHQLFSPWDMPQNTRFCQLSIQLIRWASPR